MRWLSRRWSAFWKWIERTEAALGIWSYVGAGLGGGAASTLVSVSLLPRPTPPDVATYILQACVSMGFLAGLLAAGIVKLTYRVRRHRLLRWILSIVCLILSVVFIGAYMRSLSVIAARPPLRDSPDWMEMIWKLSVLDGVAHAFFVAGGVFIVAVLARGRTVKKQP